MVTSKNQVYINQAFDKASLVHLPTPGLLLPPLLPLLQTQQTASLLVRFRPCLLLLRERAFAAALRGPPLCICFVPGAPIPPPFQGGPSSGPLEGPPTPLTEPRLLIATEEGSLLLAERTSCRELKFVGCAAAVVSAGVVSTAAAALAVTAVDSLLDLIRCCYTACFFLWQCSIARPGKLLR